MTFAWHHPNYYKKLKREATSSKPQAYQINYDDFCKGDEEEPSHKLQASSVKLQAASDNMKNFNIVSGKDINKALEKMNNWHFRYDSNTYTTFNKVENALRKNWLWKTKEINKFKKILFKLQADKKNPE